jgi:hypothetical protein
LKLPSLSLTADAGVKSEELTAVTLTTGLFNLGANLFGPLFNAGRNQQRVEIERARTEQLLNSYEQTILNAFREVEDALVAAQTYRDEYEARQRQVDAAQEARSARRLRDTPASARLDRRSLPGAGRRMVGSPDRDGLRLAAVGASSAPPKRITGIECGMP